MPRTIPYLQRRGDAFNFRIAVPVDLRPFFRCRELSKSLGTGDKHVAVPRSFLLAYRAKQLFHNLRDMTKRKKADDGGYKFEYTVKAGLDQFNKPFVEFEATPEETDAAVAASQQMLQSLTLCD